MASISDDYRAAMRLFPASVCIVATGAAPHRAGLTVTAVCSLTASPPQILICLNAASGTWPVIARNRRFSLNLLTAKQAPIARLFAGAASEGNRFGDGRFDEHAWRPGPLGSPILNGAVMSIDCDLMHAYQAETHMIVIGGVRWLGKSAQPDVLAYVDGRFSRWSSGEPAGALA